MDERTWRQGGIGRHNTDTDMQILAERNTGKVSLTCTRAKLNIKAM